MAPTPSALQTMARFAASVRPAGVPASVRDKARSCLTDVLWGCLWIHHDHRALAALRSVPLDGPGAKARVLTSAHRAGAADAAFVSAVATASTDRSDTHVATATHPGIVVIPALLAALQERGGSGEDLERGIIVGYEIMGRIARAVMSPTFGTIFRPTAVAAPVAAAVAVASALRLDERAMVVAGSLAAQTAIGFNEWARAGTGEHAFHAGFAARNAVLCAYLAAEGVEAAATALEGRSGLLAGYGVAGQAEELTRDLGQRYELDGIVFKPAPACFFAQTPIQVAVQVAEVVKPDEIDRIHIGVTGAAAEYPGCAATQVDTVQGAVMSIPFAVASTLRAGKLDPGAWTRFENADTAALAQRCTVTADEAISAAYPACNGTSIVVTMRDGSTVTRSAADFVSMDAAAVSARFLNDADEWIGQDAARATLAAIARFETLDDVAFLSECCLPSPQRSDLRRSARP